MSVLTGRVADAATGRIAVGSQAFDLGRFGRPGMVPPEPGQAVTVAIPVGSVMVVDAGEAVPDPLVKDEEAG